MALRPRGNTLSLKERIAKDYPLGSLRMQDENAKGKQENAPAVYVKYGPRGRGLVAARDIQKDKRIATILFYDESLGGDTSSLEHFQMRDGTKRPLAPPTDTALGNLANTALGAGGNNAELRYDAINDRVNLVAKVNICEGVEVLTAYGREYTSQLKAGIATVTPAGPLANAGGWLKCAGCEKRFRRRADYARHTALQGRREGLA